MPSYCFKDFEINYKIQSHDSDRYLADGYVLGYKDEKFSKPLHFSTEHTTEPGAESELKKIIEQYLKFEHKQFLAIQARPSLRR